MSHRSSTPTSSPSPRPASPPHAYESFADLVPSPTSSSRRGLFSTPPRRWRSERRGSEALVGSGGVGEWTPVGEWVAGVEAEEEEEVEEEELLSTLELVGLTVGLAGAQLTWTVEMAFGTPYLLSLGLSKQSTSLVWLAGPLSGLLVQPIIGALSDSSSSRYRRRFFILVSSFLVVFATLIVAYAHAIAAILQSLSGLGDWDPSQEEGTRSLAIFIAVVGFYALDFSLNGLQASLRALILDRSPSSQQNVANAWHGRMTHIANIFGYLAGYIDLGHWTGIAWVGGGQFRKLAVLSCGVMAICVGVTCYTQEEIERTHHGSKGIKWAKALKNIRESIRDLPLSVRRVCYVQFFAWTAYFPFLFYSTTWVAEVFYAAIPIGTPPPSSDTATRAGSLALLLFAIVAFLSGSFLPWLSTLGRKPFIARLSHTSRKARAFRGSLCLLTPRNFWTMGLAMYALCMIGTFWVKSVHGAMVIIALLGVPWAINCWVPFALVMESIRDLENIPLPRPPTPPSPATPSYSNKNTFPQPFRADIRQPSLIRARASAAITECSPLLPDRSDVESSPLVRGEDKREQAGGTILGIHNLAIVAPQFFVAIVAAIIFKIIGAAREGEVPGEGEDGLRGSNDVVWVLRFGGLASIAGTVASRWVLKTRSERTYVKMLKLRDDDVGEEDDEDAAES